MSSPVVESVPGGPSPAVSSDAAVAAAAVEALVPCLGSLSLTNSTTVAEAKAKEGEEVKHQEPFQERNITDEDKKVNTHTHTHTHIHTHTYTHTCTYTNCCTLATHCICLFNIMSMRKKELLTYCLFSCLVSFSVSFD